MDPILNSNEAKQLEEELDLTLLGELGTLAFENALTAYLAESEFVQVEEFSNYLQTQSEEEDFLPKLCEKYPRFCELLQAETIALQAELAEIKIAK